MKKFTVHGYRSEDKKKISVRWTPQDEQPTADNTMVGLDIDIETVPLLDEQIDELIRIITNGLNSIYSGEYKKKKITVPTSGLIKVVPGIFNVRAR